MLRRQSNFPMWIMLGVVIYMVASNQGFSLNPSVNGTPVSVPGMSVSSETPAGTELPPGPGADVLGTQQQSWVLTAQANGTVTLTPTLAPGETPTVGPTNTLEPLIVQTGDLQATIDLLKRAEIGYQSSEISAGAQVGCGVVEQTSSGIKIPIGIPFTAYQYGYTPENSKFTQSVTLCFTIKAGWSFYDLAIDWSQSKITGYETVSETTNEQGQKVIVQKPIAELVIVARRPACVTAIHLGKNQTQIAFTKTPSTQWQALAPLFGVSYVAGMDAQLQSVYDQAYVMAVSEDNLAKAREQANYSLTHISTGSSDPDGSLYADLKSLIAQTGNWASFTLKTQVPTANAPFIYCADGVAVP